MKRIYKLLEKLDIKTNNIKLYAEAMTHNSYKNEAKIDYTYQRLEFLGDAIISKLVACYLYYQGFDEHQMTEIRKMLVSADTLKRASDELNLIDHAYLGRGIDLNKDTRKIKEDLYESLVGAIYVDKGEKVVYQNLLEKTLIRYWKENQLSKARDYKSLVQELFQSKISNNSKSSKTPYYETKEIENKRFKSTLFVGDVPLGYGYGDTKKDAEKKAAEQAYLKYAGPKN